MAQQINPPRGMRDFLPDVKARRERVLNAILQVYRRHGFAQIETPVMEDLTRLTSGMGGDNEKLAFRVMRRGLTADKLQQAAESGDEALLADLGLRFDLTVPLARYYATHQAELPRVFRSIQAGPVWRAERPQKGRYRQFMQCDIDILGESSVMAELELITATSNALAELGLAGCAIRINDRRILNAILADAGFEPQSVPKALISIDKLDKIGADGVLAELVGAGLEAQAERLGVFLRRVEDAGQEPLTRAGIETLLAGVSVTEAVDNLTEINDAVRAAFREFSPEAQAALPTLIFDPTLVRGMGYYTGTIFEIAHPESGSSIGGGGRYDGMIGRFLGQDVPACGFSIGFERIIDLVQSKRHSGTGLVLLYQSEADKGQVLGLKAQAVATAEFDRIEVAVIPKKGLSKLLDSYAQHGFTEFAEVEDITDYEELDFRPIN